MHNRIESWLETGEFSSASAGLFPVSGPRAGIGALLGWTAGTPVATPNRWAPGALSIDYTNAIPYYNSGTYASPTWTSLLAGGAVATAFVTIACPAGTNPVADTTTDTLTLTSSGGTMTITGTAASDTINFDIAATSITNGYVNASAAIAYSKLAALTRGSILRGETGNVATVYDAKGDGKILVGDGTDVASVSVSGDVTLLNTGATTVTDLTITGEAQGDILYRNATNWVRLPAGTSGQALVTAGAGSNPFWGVPTTGSASNIVNNCTLEGGTYDPVLIITTQTVGSPNLTIPDFANVDDVFTFNTLAATLLSKGLDDATCYWGDTADMTKKVVWELSGATTAKTLTLDSNHSDDRNILFPDATTTLVGTDTTDALSNKTLTAAKIVNAGYLADANGNEQVIFNTTATAVNHFTITNSAAANPATQTFAATGTDANIHCLLQAKGTGKVQAQHGGGAAVEIVTLSDSQALTGKTYEGLTITTSASGVLTIAGSKTLTCNNTLTLAGTDSTVMTFPGTSQTIAGLTTAQAWGADQTFGNTNFHLLDSAGTHDLIIISTGTGMSADRTLTLDCTNAAATFAFNGNISFASTVSFAGAMSFAGAWTHAGAHTVGITTQNNGTFAFADGSAYALTFPTGTDTLVGKATSDVFTNKSFNCDGTGNALTNVNATELDAVTVAADVYAVPFLLHVINTGAADITITLPYKCRIIYMIMRDTKAGNAGTWQLRDATGGAGNPITTAVAYATSDNGLSISANIDNAEDVNVAGAIYLRNSNAADTADGWIFCTRED